VDGVAFRKFLIMSRINYPTRRLLWLSHAWSLNLSRWSVGRRRMGLVSPRHKGAMKMNTPHNTTVSEQAGCIPAAQGIPLSTERLGQLIQLWNSEHVDLSKNIQDTSIWLGQVSQLGRPRFGELATRLSVMRDRMKRHFEHEELLGHDLRQVADCVETVSSNRRAASDHQHLLQRVDELISKLRELEPPFDSFQQAIDQVGLFVDAFEQHEEQEAAGLQWLTHTNSDPRRMPR